jgi:Uma2 family endonuclease
MVASLLTRPGIADAFAEFAHPEPLAGGIAPEERVVWYGIGWERHLALDKALGDDRSGPRFYFLDGDLEIMSTSDEHERIKKLIADCMLLYFMHAGIDFVARGQATMRLSEHAAAEPDESWCLHDEKRWPDLVIEIALTSGGLPKLDIYRQFAVPEVWMWRRGRLEIHCLRDDGSGYERTAGSRLLPDFPLALLEQCAGVPASTEARSVFRDALR